MPNPWSDKYQSWLYSAVKRLANQGHTSDTFELYQDKAPRGAVDSVLPSHPIIHSSNIPNQAIPYPAPIMTHEQDNGVVMYFGDQGEPPCQALKLAPIPDVPNNKAWIAVDGGVSPDATTDEPWALKAPGVGFLDAWVDGESPTPNGNNVTYKVRFYWGDPEPKDGDEIVFGLNAAGPTWDPSTGVLFFAAGDPYDIGGISPGASIWLTGYLYTGQTVKDAIDTSSGSGIAWNRVVGCIPDIAGVGTLDVSVPISISPAASDTSIAYVFHNGLLLMPTTDYTFSVDKLTVNFTQARRILHVGDEIQIQYPTAS